METGNLIKLYGNILVFTTPSGYEVAIREQNGNDDAILSNLALAKDSTSVNAFIQSIVVGVSYKEGLLSDADVLDMRLGDKYMILIKSRIFSVGPILKFQYEWVEGIPPTTYEEDLEHFVWDYVNPLPRVGERNYFKDRIQPYPKREVSPEFTTQRGHLVRYKFLNGYGEQYLLKLPDFNTHINSKVIARELEMQVDGKWIRVEDFGVFSSRETAEIRDHMEKMDPQFEGAITITDPSSGNIKYLSLIGLHDFFFQRGI